MLQLKPGFNQLTIFINLISSFPFSLKYSNITESSFIRVRDKKKVLKNFLVFLCLINQLKALNTNASNIDSCTRCSYFTKINKKKTFTLLRAPFRHKLTKKNFSLIRFSLIVKLTLNLKSIPAFQYNNVYDVIELIKIYFSGFESNVIRSHKIYLTYLFLSKRSNWIL